MAREIIWSEPALDDLTQIVEFIARDSQFYAEMTEKKVHEAARSLRHFPLRSRVVPEFSDPNVREIFIHSYRLIFEISETRITIHAVLHSARQIRDLSSN